MIVWQRRRITGREVDRIKFCEIERKIGRVGRGDKDDDREGKCNRDLK